MTIKSDGKKVTVKAEGQLNSIIEYLSIHPEGKVADFEGVLGVKSTRVKQLLYELLNKGVIEAVGTNKNRTYRLKR